MATLDTFLDTTQRLLPGLLDALNNAGLAELEVPGGPGISLFRSHGGPGLLVAKNLGGRGADALEAAHVVMGLGYAAPSLAVGTVMHHFSIATLFIVVERDGPGAVEAILLEDVATNRKLIASAISEGGGGGILRPAMSATTVEGGYLVNGSKKPCSLSRSMDYLTANVKLPDEGAGEGMGLFLVPSDKPGITVAPFWSTTVLAGAESDEIRLTDLLVETDFMIRPPLDDESGLDSTQAAGFVWFELLISAAYTGIAWRLASVALCSGRADSAAATELAVSIEAITTIVEGAARMVRDDDISNSALAKVVLGRLAIEGHLATLRQTARGVLGGMAFVNDDEGQYLARATQALAYHPPSRAAIRDTTMGYLHGQPFQIEC